MRRWLWLLAGLVVLLAGAATFTRGVGFGARATPSALETSVMRAARRWAIPAEVRSRTSPVEETTDVIEAAKAHWADHCATCHGNDGRGQVAIGRSLYPPAPDMREAATQELTDGELFYIIERGVPFTGMPAWGNGTPDGERGSWELVHFIRYLPRLTEAELEEMEAMNPKSPAQAGRDRKIEDFLEGGR